MIYFIKLIIKRIREESIILFLRRIPARFVYVYSHYRDFFYVRFKYYCILMFSGRKKQCKWSFGDDVDSCEKNYNSHAVRNSKLPDYKADFSSQSTIKPSALFLIEKWCDANPAVGLSNSAHNLINTLELSGYASYSSFHFDEYYYEKKCSGDKALLEKCINEKIDFIVLTWLFGVSAVNNPRIETLKIIRNKLNVPIVALWYDSANPHVMDTVVLLESIVDLNVVIDSTTAFSYRAKFPEKYLPLWTPQDSRLFFDPGIKRDIGVSFVGSMNNYADRELFIKSLIAAGINIHLSGGQRENKLSVEEYACTFQRSKITLNFSNYMTTTNIKQYKGRIFEATLCGAMLMELENPETAKWFEPMIDYIPFTDEKDLVDKVNYYLNHEEERVLIAERGHRKAVSLYTGTRFWHEILQRVQ